MLSSSVLVRCIASSPFSIQHTLCYGLLSLFPIYMSSQSLITASTLYSTHPPNQCWHGFPPAPGIAAQNKLNHHPYHTSHLTAKLELLAWTRPTFNPLCHHFQSNCKELTQRLTPLPPIESLPATSDRCFLLSVYTVLKALFTDLFTANARLVIWAAVLMPWENDIALALTWPFFPLLHSSLIFIRYSIFSSLSSSIHVEKHQQYFTRGRLHSFH